MRRGGVHKPRTTGRRTDLASSDVDQTSRSGSPDLAWQGLLGLPVHRQSGSEALGVEVRCHPRKERVFRPSRGLVPPLGVRYGLQCIAVHGRSLSVRGAAHQRAERVGDHTVVARLLGRGNGLA